MPNSSPVSAVAVALVAGAVTLMAWNARHPAPRRMDDAIAKAMVDRELARTDAEARAALDAFHVRTWNPARDARIMSAELAIAVTFNRKRGRYHVRFDGSKELNKQVVMETLEEEAGLDPRARPQAKRFANMAMLGAYQTVVRVLPPIRLQMGREDNDRIVVAPPFRSERSVSYRMSPNGLVWLRGEIDGQRTPVRDKFTWMEWETGAVLTKVTQDAGVSVTSYQYAGGAGYPALERATVEEKDRDPAKPDIRFEATFKWSDVVKRPAEKATR